MRLDDCNLEQLLQEIVDVAGLAEAKYGPFTDNLADVRLGIAALQDEVDEVLLAWRQERRRDDWNDTRSEVLQVAGVALRLAAALPGGDAAI